MKRQTIQRTLTLEAVRSLRCHATADEVHAAVSTRCPTISKGTVYRNLHELAQSGEIRRLEIPNATDRFAHQCCPHDHLRFIACGRVFDVDTAGLPPLEEVIRDKRGFELCGYDLMFRGICPNCQTRPA